MRDRLNGTISALLRFSVAWLQAPKTVALLSTHATAVPPMPTTTTTSAAAVASAASTEVGGARLEAALPAALLGRDLAR